MLGRVTLILINSLLFFSLAFSSNEDKYLENMITIRVGNFLKQDFYEVMSDYDGGIYIDIKDFLQLTELTEYTELTLDKENISLFMDGNLFCDKKERLITRSIKELKIIEIESRIYIKKEKIGELFPLKEIKWIQEKYTLEIFPNFNLPLEYRINAKKRKNTIEGAKCKQKSFHEPDIFMEEDRKLIDVGMLKIRYDIDDIGSNFEEKEKNDKGNVEVEYSSQLLYGDFNIRQNLYSTGKLEEISLKYPYIFKNKAVIIGDNFIEGNDILGYDSKIRGISISDSGYNVKRSGRDIIIRGEAPKNSTVEIYQNGKIADYQSVDGNDYEFTLEMRTQNDEFQIKIYDRNGIFIEEKNVNVMVGNEFLTKGEWNYNFFYGQNPQGENRDWDDLKYGISYGLTNRLTYSLDYYNTKNEEKLYRYIKHRMGYRFLNLPIPLVTNFEYYDSFKDKSKGYIAELRTEIFSQKLYYTYECYTDILATDQGKDYYHEVEIDGAYGRTGYYFRFSNKNYLDEVEEKYDAGLSYDLTKNLQMDIDIGKIIKKNDNRSSDYTGNIDFNYGWGDYTYSLDTRYNDKTDPKWEYTGRLRKRLSEDTKYSYNIEVKYNKKESFSLGFGFEYKFNDFFKMNYDYNNEKDNKTKVGVSLEKVVNLKNPMAPNTSKDPDNGYLEGVVFIDKNGNGKKEICEHPLEGVGVGIGNNIVKTNKAGLFYLSNVYPYRKNKLIYDYCDTMIDPTLKAEDFQELEIIPATGKHIEIGLVPVSILMGSICLPDIEDNKIKKKVFAYMEIIVEKDGNYFSSIKPEYDGFFVVQDLKPGLYSLKINYLGREKIKCKEDNLEVIVKSGETGDFYEGIDFIVTEIKNLNSKGKN